MSAVRGATNRGHSRLVALALAVVLAALVLATTAWLPARAAEGEPGATPPVRRALVIGMSDYDDPRMRVPGDRTRADAEGVAATLRGVAGYVAPTLMPADADTVTFMKRFSEFARSVEAGDQVLLFYSGHGVEFRGDAYLLLREAHADLASDGDDAVTKAALDRSAVKVKDLVERLQQRGASNIIVVLNACRTATDAPIGGQLGTGDGADEGFDLPPPGKVNGLQARQKTGVGVLFATSGDTFAEVCAGNCATDPSPYTVFGRRFIEGLGRPNLRVSDLRFEVGAAVLDDVSSHFPGREQRVDWHDQTSFDARGEIFLGPVEAKPSDVVEVAKAEPPAKLPAAALPATGPAPDIWASPDAVACAELAAPAGWNARFRGVRFEAMDIAAATSACGSAARAYPDAQELTFLLGRTEEANGNYEQALAHYRAGADAEYAFARAALANLYEDGHGVAQNYLEAARYYRLAAEQGNASGQLGLGRMYLSALGVPRDDTEAARLFRLAANQGNAAAQANLGYLYEVGRGLEKSSESAVVYWLLAAQQGDAQAQLQMGYSYEVGRGTARNDAEAARYYRLAADQGEVYAQYSLGNMYFNGRGVAQSDTEAVRYYAYAAEKNYTLAQYNLGNMYSTGRGVARDDAEAVRYYRLAADAGYVLAQYNLGNMYFNGRGVDLNYVEAVRYYRLAADQGYADAQFNLGNMYARSQGVPQDTGQARHYYQLAADQGQANAAEALERLNQ